jgi:hypothetical protein
VNEGVQPRPHIDIAETTPAETEDAQSPSSLDDDEDLQREVIGKLKTANEKGKANRMGEVSNARTQRLYYKDIQQIAWNEDDQDVVFGDDEDAPYSRTFNIFQGYGKIFQALFMGATAKVRAEADDPFNPASIRNTSQARTYERIYSKNNDQPTQQLEVSRLMWTDGRIITRTTQRNGKEITEFFGVLEGRVNITAKTDMEIPLRNCTLIELEDEYPVSQMKRDYPAMRSKISSGAGDSYERNARTAVKRQAGSDTSIDVSSGEDSYGNATKTWSYMRPEFFEEFQESSRAQLQQMFPAGLLVVRNGDTYLESEECDVDSCLDVIHALPGDGQSRGSIGQTTVTLQDSANTAGNLIEEIFDHGLPTIYYNEKSNVDGLNNQREMPGASRKATGITGEPLSNMFYSTPAVNPSAQLMEYAENVRGPMAQFAAALPPAAFGEEMQDQKTASGYAQAKTQALGQLAIVWRPYTAWKARELTRAVKMASGGAKEIKASLPSASRSGRQENVRLNPASLQGLSFENDSDESFPESFAEKGNKFMSIMQAIGPQMSAELWQEPDNLYFAKDVWGLEELVLPGEDIRNNVLEDIAQMEHDPLQPDPTAMPSSPLPAMGAAPTPPPTVSPIAIDVQYLNTQDLNVGYAEVKRWINSAAGREARTANPQWFQNVGLYGMQYKNAIPAPPGPPPEPPPNVTINYADLPTTGKIQAAGQHGIQISPQDVASVPAKPTPGVTNA